MPRPCKRRRVCALPGCVQFAPRGGGAAPAVRMALDEYETLRLIDLEGMSQEECAAQMGVARTTAQAIYNSARRKLADCLVNRRELHIGGGQYVLCGGTEDCGCSRARFCRRTTEKTTGEESAMRIAVTYENGEIFQHFGHTETFKLYDVGDGAVRGTRVVSTDGSGHGALAALLGGLGVDALICGGIGGGARMALDDAGIKLYGGVSGDADAAVAALLGGTLTFTADATCSHHDGEAPHACGEHGCGGHTCGE